MKKLGKVRTQKLLDDFEKAATNLHRAEQDENNPGLILGWASVTYSIMQELKRHFGEDGFTVCLDAEHQRVYAKLKGGNWRLETDSEANAVK